MRRKIIHANLHDFLFDAVKLKLFGSVEFVSGQIVICDSI